MLLTFLLCSSSLLTEKKIPYRKIQIHMQSTAAAVATHVLFLLQKKIKVKDFMGMVAATLGHSKLLVLCWVRVMAWVVVTFCLH